MAIPIDQFNQNYDPYSDRDLRMRARSREEYEYLLEMKRQEMQMRCMSPQIGPKAAPPQIPKHLNTKLLLTKGA